MAKQWTIAHQKANPNQHYHFQVWLDTSITLPDGSPDPVYLKNYHWSLNPPEGVTSWSLNGTTYATWETYIQAETELLAQQDLAVLEATDTILSFQGTTF